MISTMMAAGCGGGGGGGAAAPSGANSTANPIQSSNTAPTIAATPAEQATVGADYELTPLAQDEDGDTLAFSIQNKPAWAVFNTASGQLSGAPRSEDIGEYRDVVISVSDGSANVALPAFSITVVQAVAQAEDPGPTANDGAVALSWDVPTTTVDGDTLNDLTGYRIHYGRSADALTDVIDIPSAGENRHVVQGLATGTYYFVVRAVTADGSQSEPSNVVAERIG